MNYMNYMTLKVTFFFREWKKKLDTRHHAAHLSK